jgi:hypothetical protein
MASTYERPDPGGRLMVRSRNSGSRQCGPDPIVFARGKGGPMRDEISTFLKRMSRLTLSLFLSLMAVCIAGIPLRIAAVLMVKFMPGGSLWDLIGIIVVVPYFGLMVYVGVRCFKWVNRNIKEYFH